MGCGELSELCKNLRDHYARHCSKVLQKGRPKARQFVPVFSKDRRQKGFIALHSSLYTCMHFFGLIWSCT